jgi:hypothetical protein
MIPRAESSLQTNMKYRKTVAAGILGTFIAAGGYFLFRDKPLPPAFEPGARLAHSLVGVVPTGGRGRIREGLKWYSQNNGPLIITGVEDGVTLEQIVEPYRDMVTRPLNDIVLDYSARDTYENAQFVEKWLQENPGYTLVLIDDKSHTSRTVENLEDKIAAPILLHSIPDHHSVCFTRGELVKRAAFRADIHQRPKGSMGRWLTKIIMSAVCAL